MNTSTSDRDFYGPTLKAVAALDAPVRTSKSSSPRIEMKHPVRWSVLSTLAISVVVAWLARAAGPHEFAHAPQGQPPAATGSAYPPPQVDPSAPPVEPAPTF